MKRIALLLLAPVAGALVFATASCCSSSASDSLHAHTLARISVKGMHCETCAGSVKSFLKKLPGVEAVHVDVDSGTVLVKITKIQAPDDAMFKKAVYDAGFEATGIARSSDDYAKVVAAYRK